MNVTSSATNQKKFTVKLEGDLLIFRLYQAFTIPDSLVISLMKNYTVPVIVYLQNIYYVKKLYAMSACQVKCINYLHLLLLILLNLAHILINDPNHHYSINLAVLQQAF